MGKKTIYEEQYTNFIDGFLGTMWCSYLDHVTEDASDMTFKEYLSAVVVEHLQETAEDTLRDCLLRAPTLVPPTARRGL